MTTSATIASGFAATTRPGHPIGATGVSMHVLTAMQVRGDAGEMQVEGARLGGVYNMGGACVASYVSILEPLR